ncbi:DUF2147 domain-containing protein [Aureitalea marina]|uniref:DUF2147 domain-containing protein n=1 Tax=Aureitalea marina TaxID=930804 RepID=A0A2S7KPK6_9FLAO|nr:DUF2147 domain-containing protein [Aureitalea marina]PQB04551.1 hypothetical protein BST85_06295 [Aureitalea marina]
MKKIVLLSLSVLLYATSWSQEVVGQWKTIDDNSGEARSIVEIYEDEGLVYGKIVQLLDPSKAEAVCEQCSGADKDQPVVGLVIIKGLEADGDEYNGGKILDPESGKLYKCYIALEDTDRLKVRGYIGFSALGRTQYWHRVK